jgi:hypothetical protein
MPHEQFPVNRNEGARADSKQEDAWVNLESRKTSYENLKRLMRLVVTDIRNELINIFGVKDGFVDGDGSIRMNNSYDSNIESQKELAQRSHDDIEAVDLQEKHWAGINDPEKRKNKARAYGLSEDADEKAILQAYRRHKETSLPNQLEMAITILLHKRFGDRYVVVRASKYDDYFNGIDNVLVNKETGDVICAFDEVRMDERSDRDTHKKERSRKKASEGGASLKYGFRIQNNKILKQTIHSIPIFCLGLDSQDCSDLINNISYTDKATNPTLRVQPMNDTEERILQKLLESIGKQKDQLVNDPQVRRHSTVIENLSKINDLFK